MVQQNTTRHLSRNPDSERVDRCRLRLPSLVDIGLWWSLRCVPALTASSAALRVPLIALRSCRIASPSVSGLSPRLLWLLHCCIRVWRCSAHCSCSKRRSPTLNLHVSISATEDVTRLTSAGVRPPCASQGSTTANCDATNYLHRMVFFHPKSMKGKRSACR